MPADSNTWDGICYKACARIPESGSMNSLSGDERELAALFRLEGDINNGGFAQFFGNWNEETVSYALSGLEKMGAIEMMRIYKFAIALVKKNGCPIGARFASVKLAMIPQDYEKLLDLSYKFMDYPDNLEKLGMKAYANDS